MTNTALSSDGHSLNPYLRVKWFSSSFFIFHLKNLLGNGSPFLPHELREHLVEQQTLNLHRQ